VRCEHGGPREDFLGGSAEAAGVGDFLGGQEWWAPQFLSLVFTNAERGSLETT
jgi:hypothetical protein